MTKAYSYIRFSTPEQLKGDSLRRQSEASRKYAEANNLELDQSMQDLGLSAYHGTHKTKGALGKFLQLVEEKKIEAGSFLIVENLDRLSRESPLDALAQFTNIINNDIKVVTLFDNQVYDKDKLRDSPMLLMGSIMYMARAHDESLLKSKRLSASWANKRRNALEGNHKLTAKAPAWLQLSADRKSFIKIPEACDTIELIFITRLSGKGVNAIEKMLNTNPNVWHPPRFRKQKTEGWRNSYVTKILNSRAVIGEFTPHLLKNGKRVELQPIKDYFPRIISDELFYQVQDLIKKNSELKGHGGGKTGKFKNLFTHIAKCGFCGAPMHFVDKGPTPKGGQYLYCDNSRRGVINDSGERLCTAKPIRYNEFEQIFFEIKDVLTSKLNQILIPDDSEVQKGIIDIEGKITANNSEIKTLERRSENLTNMIAETGSPTTRAAYDKALKIELNNLERLQNKRLELEKQRIELSKKKVNAEKSLASFENIYHLIKEKQTPDIRQRLNYELRQMFDSISMLAKNEPRYVDVLGTKRRRKEFGPAIIYRLKGSPIWNSIPL